MEPKVPTVPVVVSAREAIALSTSTNVVFADVRWYLDGRDAREAHVDGRIPGSVFVDVDRDLARPAQSPSEGRHPFPSPAAFAKHMGRLGIGNDTHVIAFDDTGGMTAARLVVMLRMIGRRASLLDGGIEAWTLASGVALETGPVRTPRGARFDPVDWPADRLVDTDDVRRIVDERSAVMLDARAPERFTGAAGASAVDPRAGHVPTAVNAPWMATLTDGRMREPDDLRAHFLRLGVRTGDDGVVYCGSGVSACLDVVALEHAGLVPPRLFVASWSGWASDETNPIETGEANLPAAIDGSPVEDRSPLDAVRALRHARQKNRLAELEWFEALYRVYLAAFIFGGGILFVSGLVPDEPVATSMAADVSRFGPGWLGLALVLATAMGLRSGARGGPLALEDADVRHLLLAPVSRHRVLLRPAFQKTRTIVFAGAAAGATAGQLAGRRLPGTSMAWAWSGALWGATAGAMFVAAALVAHGARLRGWMATAIGGGLLGWQFWSALPGARFVGPADLNGGLALWGERTRVVEIVPTVATLLLLAIGFVLLGRQSLEALARRSTLVTQLRFAVTLQDLRTVTLLRRQLSHERNRSRAWFKVPGGHRFSPEWRRGWHGLLRFPLSRITRILVLAVIAALCLTAAYEGTTAAVIGSGVALFVLGLELSEPLAQEIDHGDRTDAYPRERGRMYVALLTPCLTAAVPVAGVMTLVMWIADRHDLSVAAIVAVPAIIGGVSGACINIVSGAPDQLNNTQQQNMMPPEVAGTASLVKAVWPIVIATLGSLPMVAAREAIDNGRGAAAAATRTAIAIVLLGGLVAGWIRFRDDIKNWFANAAAESRGQKRNGASS